MKNQKDSDEIEISLSYQGKVNRVFRQIMKPIASAVDSVIAAFIYVVGGTALFLVAALTFILVFAIAFGIRAFFWLVLMFGLFACFLSTDSSMFIAGTEIKVWIALGLGFTLAHMLFSAGGKNAK